MLLFTLFLIWFLGFMATLILVMLATDNLWDFCEAGYTITRTVTTVLFTCTFWPIYWLLAWLKSKVSNQLE